MEYWRENQPRHSTYKQLCYRYTHTNCNMPSDGNFTFSVLIAGLAVPEYRQDGKVYVESNLWTPVSYKQSVREMAYGEVRQIICPVLPFSETNYSLSQFLHLQLRLKNRSGQSLPTKSRSLHSHTPPTRGTMCMWMV